MEDNMGKPAKNEKHLMVMDEEEKEILDAFEQGKLKNISMSKEEKGELMAAASWSLAENDRISIRIPEGDLKKIKERALANGIPYQALITAVLHQYADGKIRARL
jgi:predicted DNA binding CopG/RHH family protein